MKTSQYSSLSLILILTAPAFAKTWNVNAGQSIQAAINNATSGDRIQVGAGTYTEQIEITKNNIDLRASAGVSLVRPSNAGRTKCYEPGTYYDSVFGICIAGVAGNPISDVTVNGFTMSGFGIGTYQSINAKITSNKVIGSGHQGIFSGRSSGTKIQSNEVSCADAFSTTSMGIQSDRETDVGEIKIAQNKVSNCEMALTAQISKNVDISNNQVISSCMGIVVALADNAAISNNRIGVPASRCALAPHGISFSASNGFTIDDNIIEGPRNRWNARAIDIWGGAISGDISGAVTSNKLRNNVDGNIKVSDQITSVRITRNTCTNPSTECNFP